ncbi:hypothetical protein [Pseudomonas sp. CJQ_11]|uniref:hypothetical protein n=1 Tax=Pseudomonas sp. CJQ_11 TaxID=3367169 RepID=UPI00370AE1DD
MPLIDCPDCHREISASAVTCPGCGRPMFRPRRQSLAFSALKNFIVAGACFGALYWIFSAASTETQRLPQPAEQTAAGWPRGPNAVAFSKDFDKQGRSVCSVFVTPVNRDSPVLLIQKYSDQNLVHIKLRREGWDYPRNTWGKLEVAFPDGNPLTLNGFRSGQLIDATIPAEATVAFVSKLREAGWIMLSLADGREPTWRVDLSGMAPNMAKLNTCAMEQRASAG